MRSIFEENGRWQTLKAHFTLTNLKAILNAGIDLQSGRLLLWLPLNIAIGISFYFSLKHEPQWIWIIIPWVILLIFLYFLRSVRNSHKDLFVFGLDLKTICHFSFVIMGMGLVALSGVLLAKARTEAVQSPIISSQKQVYFVDAIVVDLPGSSVEKPRLLLAPLRISGLKPTDTPARLRIGWPYEAQSLPKPGTRIKSIMLINPPAGSAYPGGFSYARKAYFQGIGGVGTILGEARLSQDDQLGAKIKTQIGINQYRWALGQKIYSATNDHKSREMAGIGVALITGYQSFVTEKSLQDMRDLGLAHLLSISGVHMAIVGGFLFASLRAFMALFHNFAQIYPIKKVAALGAIVGIAIYLIISGAPAPAMRAAIVGWVALGAIIFDRRALSLRSLSLAAILIMIISPEFVIDPGFQMSFAATAALLAFYEARTKALPEMAVPVWIKAVQSLKSILILSIGSSFVAGFATMPFSLNHFQRISSYGLFANLLEAPITTFVVMPFLSLGAVFMMIPGFETFAKSLLAVANMGLWVIIRLADIIASLPGSVIMKPATEGHGFLFAALGLFALCLWRGHLRWVFLVPIFALWFAPPRKAPDLWLDPQGANAAIIVSQSAYVLRDKVKTYGFERFIENYHLRSSQDKSVLTCHAMVCQAHQVGRVMPVSVGFWFGIKSPKDQILRDLCAQNRLVIIRSWIEPSKQICPQSQIISGKDFAKNGAMSLVRVQLPQGGYGWAIELEKSHSGIRPWTRQSMAGLDQ